MASERRAPDETAQKLQYLEDLKDRADDKKWDNEGQGFWGKRTPAGISELRKELKRGLAKYEKIDYNYRLREFKDKEAFSWDPEKYKKDMSECVDKLFYKVKDVLTKKYITAKAEQDEAVKAQNQGKKMEVKRSERTFEFYRHESNQIHGFEESGFKKGIYHRRGKFW